MNNTKTSGYSCLVALGDFVQKPQKQLSRGVPWKKCSESMQQIYGRTPTSNCDFNKVASFCNFIEITIRHGCSPVNFLHIFRTSFTDKNF